MTTKGVEDGMGAACDPTNDSERCGLNGNWCHIHHCYPATCEKLGLGIHAKPAVPVATPAMKDEVATTKPVTKTYADWPLRCESCKHTIPYHNPGCVLKDEVESASLMGQLKEAHSLLSSVAASEIMRQDAPNFIAAVDAWMKRSRSIL